MKMWDDGDRRAISEILRWLFIGALVILLFRACKPAIAITNNNHAQPSDRNSATVDGYQNT